MRKGVVALVGRPNTGKSTLFNAIMGEKISIVEDIAGVTRDRIYGLANFADQSFHLIDTGGINLADEQFNQEIKMQVELAIDEADLIIFVVDGKEGLNTNDFAVRDMLLKVDKKVVVAINKSDSKYYKEHQYDFYDLGLSQYFVISAEQKEGLYDLLDYVIDNIEVQEKEYDEVFLKFSVIGRPNVGKSSLVNALLKEERVLVSSEPGTTRDAVDTVFKYYDQNYVVIDTAGLRKRGRVYETIEKYSLIRTLKAIDRSDVCLVLIDAKTGIIEHDKHIVGYALTAGKAIVLVVNKWDLVDKEETSINQFQDLVRQEFAFIPYVPIVFLSAFTKKRMHTLMPEVLKVYENAKREIPTNLVNDVIRDAFYLNQPPGYKGRRLKLYFSHQARIKPPVFNIQVNDKGLVHFSYQRYLENKLRESFDFTGTPIVLQFKNKGEERQ